jgi:uncharacterized membrane protein YkvA (DUF1232 family)
VPDPQTPPITLTARHWYSVPAFWNKLGRIICTAGHKTVLSALTLFYCLQDRDTPKWAKGVIIGALGYLILPTDVIPDVLPGIGYTDDWGALVAALATVAAYIKDEHKTAARARFHRLFHRKSVDPDVVS